MTSQPKGRLLGIVAIAAIAGAASVGMLSSDETAPAPGAADEALREADDFATVLTLARVATRRRIAGEPVDAEGPMPSIPACEEAVEAGEDRLFDLRRRLSALSAGKAAPALPPAVDLTTTLEACAGRAPADR